MFQKLQPFFNLKIRSFEDVVVILLGLAVLGFVIFNAYFLPITYDEAYSYLNTGRIQDVWKIYQFRIANTHVLNSLLMTVSTLFFPYVDFALRLPIVILSIFFMITAISFSKGYKNRLLLLGLLFLFYDVTGYFSLARGYGMSAAFILAALFVHANKEKFKSYHLWVVYLFLLAIYSSYVAIIPFIVMVGYMFVFDFGLTIPDITKKHKRWILGLTAVAFYGFYSVTKAGKPLPYDITENSQTFFEAVPQDMAQRFFNLSHVSIQLASIATLLLALAILTVFFWGKRKNPIGMITAGTFLAVFLASWVTGKPLPTGRVLVPYWPLIAFSIVELIEFFTVKLRIHKAIYTPINVLLLGLLVFNFQSKMHLAQLIPVHEQMWKTPINIMAGYGKPIFPHDEYYVEKEWKYQALKHHLDEIKPTETQIFQDVTSKIYMDLRVITLNFTHPSRGDLVYREVVENGAITYADTIEIGSYLYPLKNKYPVLLPFPRFGGDVLRIGGVDGNWSATYKIPKGMKEFFPPEKRHAI